MKYLLILSFAVYVYGQSQNLCGTRSDNTQLIFVDDPSECDTYLWCQFNSTNSLIAVHQGRCDEGFRFNGGQSACDGGWACTSKCEHNTLNIRVADPTDSSCRGYFSCNAASVGSTRFECNSPGVFNRNFGICSTATIAPCGGAGSGGGGPGQCGPEDKGMINDPSGCDRFFHCEDGETKPDNCPPNMHFDTTRKLCDKIENIDPPCSTVPTINTSNNPDIPKPPHINVEAARRNVRMKAMRKVMNGIF